MSTRWNLILVPLAAFLAVTASHAAPLCQTPNVICLDQGLTDDDRQTFYHKSQGTRMLNAMPFEWFLALEQKDNDQLFRADDHMARFGFIPDPISITNPYGLPVGLTRSENTLDKKAYLGFTCAACHTNRLHVNDHILQIDGSTSMQDSVHLTVSALEALTAAYGATYKDNLKFLHFATRVLAQAQSGASPTSEQLRNLHKAVGQFLLTVKRGSNNERFPTVEQIFPTPWGPSRVDALGRGGNTLFTKLDMDNLRPANAPVSIPYLWGAWHYNWVQWNGSVQVPLARNVAQALLLDADLKFDPGPQGPFGDLFDSSVEVNHIIELEKKAKKLKPPSWPENILGTINIDEDQAPSAKQGKVLFGQLCKGCHIPEKLKAPGVVPVQQYEMKLIPLHHIGTDPTHALNFYARRAKTGPLKGAFGRDTVSVPEAMVRLTTEVITKKLAPAELKTNLPSNHMQSPLAYMARPLAGVWATPPFLHNGSVPTLYQLLSPVAERSEEFCIGIGRAEFDPIDVGLKAAACENAFVFDTVLPGNANVGHEFRDYTKDELQLLTEEEREAYQAGKAWPLPGILGRTLRPAERHAIVEYLKTCDVWRYPDETWDEHLKEDPVKICLEKKAGP